MEKIVGQVYHKNAALLSCHLLLFGWLKKIITKETENTYLYKKT